MAFTTKEVYEASKFDEFKAFITTIDLIVLVAFEQTLFIFAIKCSHPLIGLKKEIK